MEKLYFNKNIFTLYLKLLINIENANQLCKLLDNNAAVEINCEFSLLQYLFIALRSFFMTLQKVQDVTRQTQNLLYFS